MDGPSRGPALLFCPLPDGLRQGSLGKRLRERGAVNEGRQKGREDRAGRPSPPPPPPRRGRRPHLSSQPLARGLLSRADGWSGARRGASRGNLVRRLGFGRGSLALGEEVCRRQRAEPVRAGRAGEPERAGAERGARGRLPGRGRGAVPARAEVRGGSALFTSPRKVLSKHFPWSRGQAPRGYRRV